MSSLAFPSLWLPRPRIAAPASIAGTALDRARRFRASLASIFTAGKEQRSSTGKCKRNAANGKIKNNTATNTACCCGCDCSHCQPGTALATATVTFSGVTLCTDCIYAGNVSAFVDAYASFGWTVAANGIWTLSNATLHQAGSTSCCQWLASGPTVTASIYTISEIGGTNTNPAACAGYAGCSFVTAASNLVLTTDGTIWFLECVGSMTFTCSGHTQTMTTNIFSGTTAATEGQDCGSGLSLSISNTLTPCGGGALSNNAIIATGGTATVVFS